MDFLELVRLSDSDEIDYAKEDTDAASVFIPLPSDYGGDTDEDSGVEKTCISVAHPGCS